MVTTVADKRIQGWPWLLTLGILLVIVGFIFVSVPIISTLASVMFLGSLLVVGGIVHIISAFWERHSSHFWIHLLIATITIVIGFLMLRNPGATVMSLTLLIAALLLSIGLFRILGSLIIRFNGWAWVLLNGLISMLLGFLIMISWPASSLWVIGLFLGIDFIFAGLSLIMIAVYFKKDYVKRA